MNNTLIKTKPAKYQDLFESESTFTLLQSDQWTTGLQIAIYVLCKADRRLPHGLPARCQHHKVRENRREAAEGVVEPVEVPKQEIAEAMLKQGLPSNKPPQLPPRPVRLRNHLSPPQGRMESAPDLQEAAQFCHRHVKGEQAPLPVLLLNPHQGFPLVLGPRLGGIR